VYLDVCFTQNFEAWRDKMDPSVVKLIERGRSIDATTYKRFEVLRTEQWHQLCRVFDKYDALIAPTMAHPAAPHGQSDEDYDGLDAQGRYKGLDMTCPFNQVGQCPALSVPAGFSADGLPIGLQVVGHRFDDLTVMRIGAALEEVLRLDQARPGI
jgi:amidase/aspartyl-tRNA(Asn)/glutamyl-tRNA(Gln) amidotransferase subunit A